MLLKSIIGTSSQDGHIGNMAHLLAQPQQKLQINYKTPITQNHQKIEPYGSSTTEELSHIHPDE